MGRWVCAAAVLALAGCAGFEVRDFDGDLRAPMVERFDVADADGGQLATAFQLGRVTCPDGRALIGSTVAVPRPVARIDLALRDDDSGVQRVEVFIEGAEPQNLAAGSGSFELKPGRAIWTADLLGEPRALTLQTAITPSPRISVTIEAEDASGKSLSSQRVTFATMESLCG